MTVITNNGEVTIQYNFIEQYGTTIVLIAIIAIIITIVIVAEKKSNKKYKK